jgi:hypothetical protein
VVPHAPPASPATDDRLDLADADLPSTRALRLTWSQLLARVYDVDSLACPRPGCSGRLRIIGAVTKPDAVRRILAHLGLPTELPTLARARDPPLVE